MQASILSHIKQNRLQLGERLDPHQPIPYAPRSRLIQLILADLPAQFAYRDMLGQMGGLQRQLRMTKGYLRAFGSRGLGQGATPVSR